LGVSAFFSRNKALIPQVWLTKVTKTMLKEMIISELGTAFRTP
jgi:hypothetical protein